MVNLDATHQPRLKTAAVAALMLAYSIVTFGAFEFAADSSVAAMLAMVSYALTIYLFYQIACMSFQRQTWQIWGSVLAAVVVGFVVSGSGMIWMLVTNWGMLLLGGTMTGRLTASNVPPQRLYLITVLIVAIFAALQLWPLWAKLSVLAQSSVDVFLTELENQMVTLGYTVEDARDNATQSAKVLGLFPRLVPIGTVLAAVFQFSVGYLLFSGWVRNQGYNCPPAAPFMEWKVPFIITPILIVVILARLIGGETMAHVADNLLFAATIYYCVCGLALMEFYMKRLRLSKMMKVAFYIMLFVAQLVGFFVAVLIGFADSFFDWRNRQPVEATEKRK